MDIFLKASAVASADALTNSAGLPTYSELVAALRRSASINPFGSVENAQARDAARALLARIPA